MTKRKSSIPLTLEVFDEKIMPRLERIFEEYKTESNVRFEKIENDVSEIKSDVTQLKSDVTELKSDVTELKSDVTDLKATTGEILFEIQGLRNEVTVAVHEYQRTNKRVDIIDKHLGINTSNLA